MSIFLTLAFLFLIGSLCGWVLEVFYRRFISSANPERRWINPGLCTGPYLPLYGSGLCLLYLIASLEIVFPSIPRIVLFIIMAIAMTGVEYIAGIWSLYRLKVRLWDYRDEWGNIQGVICPKFSLYWSILGAGYYFFIHPHILGALEWLSHNLAFSFFIGLFFGVFAVDLAHATQIITKLKEFSEEHDVIVRYESVKLHIQKQRELTKKKYHFFRPFHSEIPVREHLMEMIEIFEKRTQK